MGSYGQPVGLPRTQWGAPGSLRVRVWSERTKALPFPSFQRQRNNPTTARARSRLLLPKMGSAPPTNQPPNPPRPHPAPVVMPGLVAGSCHRDAFPRMSP